MKSNYTTDRSDRNILIRLSDKKSYDIGTVEGAESFHADHSDLLTTLSTSLPVPKRTIEATDIDQRLYVAVTVGTKYFVDRRIIPLEEQDNPAFHRALVKAAFFDNFVSPKNEESAKNFVWHIYGSDKKTNLEARGLDCSYLDRFDRFIGMRERFSSGPKEGMYKIRHGGTRDGGSKRKLIVSKSNRDSNLTFLRLLANGPNGLQKSLRCPHFGTSLEGTQPMFDSIGGEEKCMSFFEIHHAMYVNGESVHKASKDPSAYINRVDFRQMTADVVNEFLHCIILSTSYHAMIHKLQRHDDIQGWYGRFLRDEIQVLPYHWRCKHNYNKTVKWLCENVDAYTEDDIISWEDFVQLNTFSSEHKRQIMHEMTPEQRAKVQFVHINDHEEIN